MKQSVYAGALGGDVVTAQSAENARGAFIARLDALLTPPALADEFPGEHNPEFVLINRIRISWHSSPYTERKVQKIDLYSPV